MTNKITDHIEMFHERGIYLPKRTIELFGEIGDELSSQVIKNLYILDTQSDKDITILIDSPGGDVQKGFAIFDTIKNCNSPITGIVVGEASSAASFILQACDHKMAMSNSSIMLHYGEEGIASNHPYNRRRWGKFYDELSSRMEAIYMKTIKKVKPRFTKKKLNDILLFDTILSPKEALELGLVNEVKE